MAAAHRRLGVRGGALVLFGPDAAFPHGTAKPRTLKAGDVVLVDGGCRVHGYSSDITRTAVFGAPPTDRQRRVWDLVRKAQEAAFDAARPGVECQAVDAAARKVIEDGGFGPGYAYLTHRLGHGIGLDGHEWPYMVRGNATRLARRDDLHRRAGDLHPRRAGHPPRGHGRRHRERLREPRPEVVGHARGAGGGVSVSGSESASGHPPGRVRSRSPRARA